MPALTLAPTLKVPALVEEPSGGERGLTAAVIVTPAGAPESDKVIG